MYYDEYESYNDIYDGEDEAIIEAALDLYDKYDISMEEAVDIAMEKMSTIDKIGRSVFPWSYKGRRERHYKTLNSYDKKMLERLDKAFKDSSNATFDLNMSEEDKEKYRKRYDDLVSRRQRMNSKASSIADAAFDAERRNASKIETLGKGAALGAAVAGGVALYKYRKKKLAEAAKLQKEAEEAEAKAAQKQSEAENAVAQAKEASVYFDY
jgi:hypothetical protein